MDIAVLNVRDSLERIMYLRTQLRTAIDFAPIHYIDTSVTTIMIANHKDFVMACRAYDIQQEEIMYEYHFDGDMDESFRIRDFKIHALLAPDEEGYIPQKEGDVDAD